MSVFTPTSAHGKGFIQCKSFLIIVVVETLKAKREPLIIR